MTLWKLAPDCAELADAPGVEGCQGVNCIDMGQRVCSWQYAVSQWVLEVTSDSPVKGNVWCLLSAGRSGELREVNLHPILSKPNSV